MTHDQKRAPKTTQLFFNDHFFIFIYFDEKALRVLSSNENYMRISVGLLKSNTNTNKKNSKHFVTGTFFSLMVA